MSKRKIKSKNQQDPDPQSEPEPGIEGDLDHWYRDSLARYVTEASSPHEGRRFEALLSCTHMLAHELRALRRAIENMK